MNELQLFVDYKEGDTLVGDISCDSEHMLDVLPIHKKFESYIPSSKLIYLQMDVICF